MSSSREIAIAAGLKRYVSETACRRGHVCERLVSDKTCVQCSKEYRAAKYATPEGKAARQTARQRWEEKFPERAKASRNKTKRKWQKANYEQHKAADAARSRRWRKANPEKVKAIGLAGKRRRAGCPTPPYPTTSHCECCNRPQSDFRHDFHLDHCHVTGKFRGWLCARCNLGIGMLEDNVEGLKRAIRYLERVIS